MALLLMLLEIALEAHQWFHENLLFPAVYTPFLLQFAFVKGLVPH